MIKIEAPILPVEYPRVNKAIDKIINDTIRTIFNVHQDGFISRFGAIWNSPFFFAHPRHTLRGLPLENVCPQIEHTRLWL